MTPIDFHRSFSSPLTYQEPLTDQEVQPLITEWSRTNKMVLKTVNVIYFNANLEEVENVENPQTINIIPDMRLIDVENEIFYGVFKEYCDFFAQYYSKGKERLDYRWNVFVKNEGYLIDVEKIDVTPDSKIILTQESEVYLIHTMALRSLFEIEIDPCLSAQMQLLYPRYTHKAIYEYTYLKWKQVIPNIKNLCSAFPNWNPCLRVKFIKELSRSRISLQFPFSDIRAISKVEDPLSVTARNSSYCSLSSMPWALHHLITSYLDLNESFGYQENFCSIEARINILELSIREKSIWKVFQEAIESREAYEGAEGKVICFFHHKYPLIKSHIAKMYEARDLDNWENLYFLAEQFIRAVKGMIGNYLLFDPNTALAERIMKSKIKDSNWKVACEKLCPALVDYRKTLFEALYEIIEQLAPLITFKVFFGKTDFELFHIRLGTNMRKVYELIDKRCNARGFKNSEFCLRKGEKVISPDVQVLYDTGEIFALLPRCQSWRDMNIFLDDYDTDRIVLPLEPHSPRRSERSSTI